MCVPSGVYDGASAPAPFSRTLEDSNVLLGLGGNDLVEGTGLYHNIVLFFFFLFLHETNTI